jgi:5'-3' exonuclease
MSVLLVDGDNLLTIGYFGVKNSFYKGKHIGAIYHFLNTLRKSFELYNLEKICVFWDGENGSQPRKQIYHMYKENRKGNKFPTDEAKSSYDYQRTRVKKYLEELYVRQGEFPLCETDDCIAYYVKQSPNEKIIIFSSDRDYAQLVNDNVELYSPSHRKLYKAKEVIEYDKENVLIENVKTIKILCGDNSDNIYGIRNLGIKRLIEYIPEIQTQYMSVEDVIQKCTLLHEENKDNKTLQNILTGVTKLGVYGDEFYAINKKIIDLSEPLITDEAKEYIHALITEALDTEGRSYKNCMKFMMEDGLFQMLPKSDDAWIKFLNPFLRLTRKEKNKRIIKFKI